MAILMVGESMWKALSDTYRLDILQRYTVQQVPDKEYAAVMHDMQKVVGAAPKADKEERKR